jgi:phosphatidylserine/phosphatidylglycerophosphate/cardiolipin synthase-like enzyme
MMQSSTRHILRSSSASRHEIRELLQGIFVRELLFPSRCLWLVSPWIRNIEVIDNRAAAFKSLAPDLPPTGINLHQVLYKLLERGTRVVLAIRPERESVHFGMNLSHSLEGRIPADAFTFVQRDILHAKGLIGDDFGLTGSMNFTFNGVELQTELVALERDRAEVAKLRIAFAEEYGGLL